MTNYISLGRIALVASALCVAACSGLSSTDSKSSNGRDELLLRIAHSSEASGNFEGAESLYKQAVNASNHNATMELELAGFYNRHNANGPAIKVLNEALGHAPNNPEVLRALANAYINAGEPEKALPLLDKALPLDSKNALLYSSKGVALDMQGDYAQAQHSYETAILLAPKDAATFKANLSMSYILAGDYDKAIQLLLPLLRSGEANPVIRQNLALAYGLKGESDKALKLGLKDLSTKEAQDNLKFYHMLATNHRTKTHTQSKNADISAVAPEPSQETGTAAPLAAVAAPPPTPHMAATIPAPSAQEDVEESAQQEPPPVSHTRGMQTAAPSAQELPPATLPVPSLKPDNFK